MPEPWIAEEIAWLAERRYEELNVRNEAEKFVTHWSESRRKTAWKKRWRVAWHNWILNAIDRQKLRRKASTLAQSSGAGHYVEDYGARK